jgi:hypothetical protein
MLMGDGVFSERKWNSSKPSLRQFSLTASTIAPTFQRLHQQSSFDPLLAISKRILEKGEDILVFGFGN